jgi:LPXTG-motif cell wall-anchored protein
VNGTVPFTVDGSPKLASTGFDSMMIVGFGGLAAAAGVLLMAAARRRRA